MVWRCYMAATYGDSLNKMDICLATTAAGAYGLAAAGKVGWPTNSHTPLALGILVNAMQTRNVATGHLCGTGSWTTPRRSYATKIRNTLRKFYRIMCLDKIHAYDSERDDEVFSIEKSVDEFAAKWLVRTEMASGSMRFQLKTLFSAKGDS